MTSFEISSKKNWKTTYSSLKSALQKEIEMMREILANLHQEELSLLENDRLRWKNTIEDRSAFINPLRDIRYRRMDATVALTKLSVIHEKTELLPHDDELSCEILNKLDQLVALMERINLQNCRNDALFEQWKQKKEIPLFCSYPHPLHKKKRKTFVATYQQKP